MGREEKDNVLELAIRRGFIYPSYEIYGGVSGFFDYGPLGAILKNKIENKWREIFCIREGFYEISSPTIAPEEVFIASGHVENFIDPLVFCTNCKESYRADHLIEEILKIDTKGMTFEEMNKYIEKIQCKKCGGKLSKINTFNLMFKTYIGPLNARKGYLRPETAQNIFIMFNRLYEFCRKKLPFGIVQIGKSYRNEISPRQGLIRLREFTQAELELFINPRERKFERFKRYENEPLYLIDNNGNEYKISAREAVEKGLFINEAFAYCIVLTKIFLKEIGIDENRIRFRQHSKEELAHYAKDAWDCEVYTRRYGWIEVAGIAYRGDYDLKMHEKYSGKEMKALILYDKPKIIKREVLEPKLSEIGKTFKKRAKIILEKLKEEKLIEEFKRNKKVEIEINGEKIILDEKFIELKVVEERIVGEKITPHVVEPSFGIDRIIYCLLDNSYKEINGRIVLSLKPEIAPISVAVFPLVDKEELNNIALKIYEELRNNKIYAIYDEKDSIGKRYYKADEIGIPFAITVDFDTLKDNTVTIRFRDTKEQIRISINEVVNKIKELLNIS